MKQQCSQEPNNILSLPEEEIEKIKNQFIEDGLIVKKSKISKYDAKFFQVVTTSMVLVKFFLFFSFAVYALLNLLGIVLSVIYKNFNTVSAIIQVVVCFAVLFICIVIFKNINTNKKKEDNVIYINKDKFIFNFNNGIMKTPELYYSLPLECLKSIEFEVYGIIKNQINGRARFVFNVADIQISHIINSANLTEIENYISNNYPALSSNIVVDNKSSKFGETQKDNRKFKSLLGSFGCLIAAVLLFVIPYTLNYNNAALLIAGSLFLLTAVINIYAYHLTQGLILSCIFIVIGYCIPLCIIFNSGLPFLVATASNSLLLLLTFFGNIGLCLYVYILVLIIGKIRYIINKRKSGNING